MKRHAGNSGYNVVRMINSRTKTTLAVALILFSFFCNAQGNLQINPKRILFDGSRKSFPVNIANIGQDTVRYSASFVEIRMKEDGAFEQITDADPGQRFASAYLRYYPKEFVLAPKEAQTIKVELKRNLKLEAGEYRSHLLFHATEEEKPLEAPKTETKVVPANLNIKLRPVFGITIPVIVQVGTSNTKVSITDASFNMVHDTLPRLRVTFERTGNMSVYGDIKVFLLTSSGKKRQVAAVNGFGIYVPNNKRHFNINLDRARDNNYKTGKLYVLYETQSQKDPVKLAERELTGYFN
jgi:hypothetical protein